MFGLLAETHHHVEGASWLAEYWELITNLSHWLFEATTDVVFGFLLYPLAQKVWNRKVKEHDDEFHPGSRHTVSLSLPPEPGDSETRGGVLLHPREPAQLVHPVRYVSGEVDRRCVDCGAEMLVDPVHGEDMWCTTDECPSKGHIFPVMIRQRE